MKSQGTDMSKVHRIHPSRRELAELYDSTVNYWDSFVQRGVYGHAYLRLVEQLIPQLRCLGPHQPVKVLDCGTGCGLMLTSVAKTLRGRTMELFGVDLALKMLERTQQRMTEQNTRAGLCRSDIGALPFQDGEMDLVTSALTLEYARQPVDLLREMLRVARPGARLLLVTTRPYAPDIPYQILFRYKHFEAGQVARWMEQAGMDDVRLQPLAGIAYWFGQAYMAKKAN